MANFLSLRPAFLLVVVLSANIFSISSATKYEYEDIIIVDAQDDQAQENARMKRHSYIPLPYYFVTDYNQVIRNEASQCQTPSGEPGVCASLSDCYPVLYTRGFENGLRNITNYPLAEELLRASGPCSTNQKDLEENIVCCPTLYKATTPIRYPALPPNKPPVGGGGGGLGNIRIPDCGIKKVVQGQTAVSGTYPWMAAMMTRGRQFCGGSLIDSRHILTAAHCVSHMTSNDISNLRIYLGAHDVTLPTEAARQTYSVSRIYYNKGFSMQKLHHDIAVLRLSSEVPSFTKQVQPVCLSSGIPPYDTGDKMAKLSGWGKLGESRPQSSRLQEVELRVWTNSACHAKYGSYSPAGITDGMVCAGSSGGGKDACQGDSGGPLTRASPSLDGRFEQIGIVSWGIGCGRYPGVYTRVDKYRDWLDRTRAMP